MTTSNVHRITPKRRVADAIAYALEREGVSAIFGIPGGTISPLNDALLDHDAVRVFVTRHEAEAVFAACGYAMTRKQPGVVFVTSGPGLTNTLTGLAAAKCDRVPVVILAGEVPRPMQGKGALQDGSAHHLNVLAAVRPFAKAVFEVSDPKNAALRIVHALKLAAADVPGPVVVTLPLDVLTAEAPMSAPTFADRMQSDDQYRLDDAVIKDIHLRLLDEPRPLLFAGSGVRGGDGPRLLRELAERYQIPVMTTPKSKGVFPESHPLSLGVFGIGGHPSALRYVESGIGTLLAVGTGLGDLATEGFRESLRPERAFIHVDLDPPALARSYETDIPIVSPAVPFFRSLLSLPIEEAPLRPNKAGGVTTHEPAATAAIAPITASASAKNGVAMSRAIRELQRALPENTKFIIDSGEHFLFAVHYLRIDEPDQFVAMTGLGAMGSSIGLAIGAKIAEPERPVCVIIGDGGMTMSGLELMDAAFHDIPLVVAVMNDGRLGMCELGHKAVYGRVPDFAVPALDMPAFAAAIGARGYVVRRGGDIDTLAPVLSEPRAPILLDVVVDKSVALPKRDRIGAMGAKSKTTKTSVA